MRRPPQHISSTEEILARLTRRTLAQPRKNKSPFLKSYLHTVDAKSHPSPLCPLCNTHTYDRQVHLILPLQRHGPVMRPRSMVGGAPAPCGRHWVQSRTKTNTKALLHTLTNSPVHPLNPPHSHRLTHPHLSNPLCPLCKTHQHTTEHPFNCTHLYTSSNILDLWMSPGRVVPLLARWKGRLAGLP